MMERLRNHRRFTALITAVLVTAGLAGCGSSGTHAASSSSSTGATLVMESSPETSITQAFNPFVSTQAAYGMGSDGLIYEPLYEFDLASPTIQYPLLATSYAWSNGGKTITFTIRTGVKWNNGTPFTPADVVFTYDMLKANPAVNLDGLNMTSVTSSGNTVTLTFPTSEYANLENIAGTAIVPKAIWSSVTPATFTDANPVGTGPFMLSTFTPQGFTLKKNPNYWQASKVRVPKVYFPVYTSNTGALSALFTNQIDWTGNYIPGLQKDFVDTSPSTHHFYEAAGATNALVPNLNTWPTNQLPVRQAISDAINRTLIASEGESGLEAPETLTNGLTLPTYAAWSGPVASQTQSTTANPSAAEKVLENAGYTKGSDGYFQKNGQEVTLTLIDPAAYTDYASDDALIAQELRAAGINASFDGIATTTWNADVADGDFQLTLHWGNGSITPYQMYDNWLDSSLATGSNATGDYERLNDPAIDTDLAALAAAPTTAAQAQALVPLEDYVAANLPVIPTTTSADWFEYNSQHYTGWPSKSDPYESGQPSGQNNGGDTGTDEIVILHLVPVS
jgi:peptide/nickel transport system substrate-binding protein